MSDRDIFDTEGANARRAEVLARLSERQLGDIRRVVATAEGKRVLWRVLVEAKVYNSCFHTNALEMAKNEGQRDIGLFVLNEILKAAPEALEQMRKEANADKLLREEELAKAETGETKGAKNG